MPRGGRVSPATRVGMGGTRPNARRGAWTKRSRRREPETESESASVCACACACLDPPMLVR